MSVVASEKSPPEPAIATLANITQTSGPCANGTAAMHAASNASRNHLAVGQGRETLKANIANCNCRDSDQGACPQESLGASKPHGECGYNHKKCGHDEMDSRRGEQHSC